MKAFTDYPFVSIMKHNVYLSNIDNAQ